MPYHMLKRTVKLLYMRQCDADTETHRPMIQKRPETDGCVFANSTPDTDSIENRCKKDGLLTKVVLSI